MWQGQLFYNLTWRWCRRLINWLGWHFKWSFKAFIVDLIFPSRPCFSQAQKKSLNQTSPISASKTTDGLRPAPMPGLLSTALPGQEPLRELSSVRARLPRGHPLHTRHPASLPLRLTSTLILPAFCIPSTWVTYRVASVPSFYIKNEKLKHLYYVQKVCCLERVKPSILKIVKWK